MTARPILFSGPMVRAILAGAKTQTRRVIPDEWWRCLDPDDERDRATALTRCPYGVPGDRLWVRETWAESDGGDPYYRADYPDGGAPCDSDYPWRWKPSIHMPRWASRLTLEVVSVRIERLRLITAADILAEGGVARGHEDANLGRCPVSAFDGRMYPDLVSLWVAGWDGINARRGHSWASNPLVWVVEFRRAIEASP